MRLIPYILICLLLAETAICQQKVSIRFENYANGKLIIPGDTVYRNNLGEVYTVSKLKYYVSDLHFISGKKKLAGSNVYLVDASKQNNFSLEMPDGEISGLEFLLGVDSVLNVSGAQEGALDPLNDMFWTWNNGYVMFKLEGNSSASTATDNRIEYHIGGYKGKYKTMRNIYLPLKQLPAKSFVREISVCLNLDKYWTGKNNIRISQLPVITLPGIEAATAADNLVEIFSINSICCYPL